MSNQIFQECQEVLDPIKDDKEHGWIWDMFLVNYSDLYCYRNQPAMAEILAREVINRNPKNNFWRCWALYVLGRIAVLKGNPQKGIDLFKEAIEKYDQLKDEPKNFSDWFKSFSGDYYD